MGKNKFEIKPLKNIEEKKEQLPGLPFLTGEAPLPNKTKPKNAIDLFLDNKYLDIQYNKRRNELIEQDENPTAKLQEIQKLENTAKSESPDIQSKIKEQLLNNDFQSQYIMRSAEPDVQKKRVYRGPQVGFTDEEVEIPRFQEISDEQLEYLSQLEKVKGKFEEVYRKKLETAQPIKEPDKQVNDRLSGTGYTIPGKEMSAEDVARDEALKELADIGFISSKAYNTLGAFFDGTIPIGKRNARREAEYSLQATPLERFFVGGVGMLLGYGGTSTVLKAGRTYKNVYKGVDTALSGAKKVDDGFTIAGKKAGEAISKTKAKLLDPVVARPIAELSAKAAQSAQTFTSYTAFDVIGEDIPVAEKAERILNSAFLGVGLGATGSLNSPFKRIPADGLVGFTASLLETGDPKEATINALLFMGFGLINRQNIKQNEQRILYERIGNDILTYFLPQIKKLDTREQRSEARKFILDKLREYKGSNPSIEQLRKDIDNVRKNILLGLQKIDARKATDEAIRKQTAQEATRARQPEIKKLKENVEVPVEGEIASVSRDNLAKMSLNKQRKVLADLGYSETQVINLGKEDRLEIIANSIKPVNFYKDGEPELEEIKPIELKGTEPEVEEVKPKVSAKATRDKMREELFGKDDTKEPVVEKVEPEPEPVIEKPKLKTKKKKSLKKTTPEELQKSMKDLSFDMVNAFMLEQRGGVKRKKLGDWTGEVLEDQYFREIFKKLNIENRFGKVKFDKIDGKVFDDADMILKKLYDAELFSKTKLSGKDKMTIEDVEIYERLASAFRVKYESIQKGYTSNYKKLTKEGEIEAQAELDAIKEQLEKYDLTHWTGIWKKQVEYTPPSMAAQIKTKNLKLKTIKKPTLKDKEEISHFRKFLVNDFKINESGVVTNPKVVKLDIPESLKFEINIEYAVLNGRDELITIGEDISKKTGDYKGRGYPISASNYKSHIFTNINQAKNYVIDKAIEMVNEPDNIAKESWAKIQPKLVKHLEGLKETKTRKVRKPKKEPKAQVDVPKKLDVVDISPKDIKMDESKFQPREDYNKAIIDDIAENFSPAKWEEPVVWKDDAGDLFVVSGHHRVKGAVQGNIAEVPVKVLPEGTTLEQARDYAGESNVTRTQQSDFENAAEVRRRLDRGDKPIDIANIMPGMFPKAKTDSSKRSAITNLANLSYLDNNGKLKQNYESTNEFPRIISISKFVGGLRKKHDFLTDRHEDDIFTYLYTENAIKGDVDDFYRKIDDIVTRMFGMDEKPASILKALRKEAPDVNPKAADPIKEKVIELRKHKENIARQLDDSIMLNNLAQQRMDAAVKKEFANEEKVAKKYDDKWKAQSTWYRNLYRLNLKERSYTDFGEKAMIGKEDQSLLDDKHIESIEKAIKGGQMIRPEVVENFKGMLDEKNITIPENQIGYESDTPLVTYYEEVVKELKEQEFEVNAQLFEIITESNRMDLNQTSMFEPMKQLNIFGGVDRVKTLDTRQKAELETIYDELIQVNKELELLNQQQSKKQINAISYNKQFKELTQRKNEAEKQKDKIVKDTPQDKDNQINFLDSVTKYHGSPHNFKSFSLKAIDSGEGSQVQGWGLYFSDKKDIAEWYANKLGDITTSSFKLGDLSLIKLNNNDQEIFNYDPWLMEREWYKHKPFIRSKETAYNDAVIYAEIIERLLINEFVLKNAATKTITLPKSGEKSPKEVMMLLLKDNRKFAEAETDETPSYTENKIRMYDELIKLVKNDKFEYELEKARNLYTVNIESKNPNDFRWMDWDNPIDIQLRDDLYKVLKDIKSGKVKAPEYLNKKEIDLKEWEDALGISEDYLDEIAEGRQVYDLLTYLMTPGQSNEKNTSLFLRDYLELDGNKYFAMGATGGENRDTYNYVVFDDKAISIKEHSLFEPSKRFPNFDATKKPFRENATQEQKDLTSQLRKELSEPNPRGTEDSGAWSGLGAGYTIRGNAITKPIREKGFIDLVGTKVKTYHDLAMAAQILRDPRYETLRIFYVKDNKVVHQNAISNRLPGAVMGLNDVSGKDLSAVVISGMRNTGADGYYMMHNHPSGFSQPSQADIDHTLIQDREVKGFLGHIIINSGEYTLLSKVPNKNSLDVKTTTFGVFPDDPLLKPSKSHEYLGRDLSNVSETVKIAKELEHNGFFTIIGTDVNNKIRGVIDVPFEFFNGKLADQQKRLQDMAVHTGSHKLVSIVDANSGISAWHLTTLNQLNVTDSMSDIIVKQGHKITGYAEHEPQALTFGQKGSTLVAEKDKSPRRKALARAHILENEVGLTDDERRTYKKVITGYNSLGEASDAEIAQYIDFLLERKHGSKPIRRLPAMPKKTLKQLAEERKAQIGTDKESVIQKAAKVMKKPVDTLGLYWVYNRQSMERTLEKMGEGGKNLLKMFSEADYYHAGKVKPVEAEMERLWKKVPTDEKDIMKNIIEAGGASDISKDGQKFLRFWQDTTNDIYVEGKKFLNPDVNYIENYFPLSLKPEIYNDLNPQHPRWDEVVDHVQRVLTDRRSQGDIFSGYEVSRAETERYVIDFLADYKKQGLRQHFIQQVFTPGGQFKHSYPLELHRDRIFPEWAYENDIMNIAHAYIDKSYEAIGYAKEFGKMNEEYKYENIDKELDKISRDGYDHKLAANIMGFSMGLKRQDIYDQTFNKVARASTTFLLTPRTTLKNLTDLGKAFAQSGARNTLYSLARLYVARNKKDRQLAHDLIGSKYVFAQSLEKTGIGSKAASFYADNIIFFTRSERAVRETIGFSRILQAEQLLKNYDPEKSGMMQDHIKRLFNVATDGLDIDVIKARGYFTRSEKFRIGNNAIGATQPTSEIDKPYNWSSKGFWTRKSIFQSFSHKSIRWLKDFILQETKNGNMFPMVNLILWRLALGYGYKEASDWLWNKEPEKEEEMMNKAFGIMVETGEIGIIGDLLFAVQYSGWANPFISLMFGPKYSLLFETLMNFGQVANRAVNDKENPLRPVKKQIARMTYKRIPGIGQEMYEKNFPRRKKSRKKLKTKKAPSSRSKGRQPVYQ